MLERMFFTLSQVGAEWVLYLLVGLSVISIAIMIERALFFARRRADAEGLAREVAVRLSRRDLAGAHALVDAHPSMEAQVLAEGLASLSSGTDHQQIMASELTRQRSQFDRRLLFLGTLGNNAPFVGLLGTVLGIIKAFHDLSLGDPTQATSSAQAVMAGISEALVATAVGLAVALPAVVAFNAFKGAIKGRVAATESLTQLVSAHASRLAVARAEVA